MAHPDTDAELYGLNIREQFARIDRTQAEIAKMQAETNAIKMRTFPAWMFIAGIVFVTVLNGPIATLIAERLLR